MTWKPTLSTAQMAEFVHAGMLRFDALVPDDVNRAVLDHLPAVLETKVDALTGLGPACGPSTGTPISRCHVGTPLGEVLALPEVRGIVASLVGPDPTFDHDFVHHLPAGHPQRQHLHADAVIDTAEPAFDVQLFYFPHDVEPGAGGTRFVPGTHLRRVSSTSLARYQHIVGERFFCGPAGTVLVFHHGLWHAGSDNPSAVDRWMYKIRLNPVVPQTKLWALDDFEAMHNDPTDHVFATSRTDSVAAVLRRRHPWQSEDERRYDLVDKIRLWRHLSGDDRFDVDHYLTRHERPA